MMTAMLGVWGVVVLLILIKAWGDWRGRRIFAEFEREQTRQDVLKRLMQDIDARRHPPGA